MGVTALLENKTNYLSHDRAVSQHKGFMDAEALDDAEALANADGSPLHESLTETRLKTLLKALPAGVVVLDGEGRVQECNPAAIELLDEPLMGLPWRTVINRAFDHNRISGQDSITQKGRIVSISTCPLGKGVPGQIILLQDVTGTSRSMTVKTCSGDLPS